MSELQVRVNFYRIACSLSDADTYFSSNQRIRVRAVFSLFVPLHKIIEARMLGYQKNEVKILREFCRNEISKCVSSLPLKLVSTQEFEYKSLHTKE